MLFRRCFRRGRSSGLHGGLRGRHNHSRGKPEADGKRVDYFGNSNVVEQAGILGCERIILVTSVGCGETKGAVSDNVYKVLEEALLAKNKAERDLRTYTNLDWTIIRPGGLKSEPSTGEAIFTEDRMASGVINRRTWPS